MRLFIVGLILGITFCGLTVQGTTKKPTISYQEALCQCGTLKTQAERDMCRIKITKHYKKTSLSLY